MEARTKLELSSDNMEAHPRNTGIPLCVVGGDEGSRQIEIGWGAVRPALKTSPDHIIEVFHQFHEPALTGHWTHCKSLYYSRSEAKAHVSFQVGGNLRAGISKLCTTESPTCTSGSCKWLSTKSRAQEWIMRKLTSVIYLQDLLYANMYISLGRSTCPQCLPVVFSIFQSVRSWLLSSYAHP